MKAARDPDDGAGPRARADAAPEVAAIAATLHGETIGASYLATSEHGIGSL